MSNNSFNSSFYGAETNEWIGIVLPFDSQRLQQAGVAGWGIRRRVAIMGHHPNDNTISDEQIVFAVVALPTTSGSGAAGKKMTVRVTQGDVVLGKFLDDEDKQTPIITHVLGRTQDVKFGNKRFDSKTGFVGSEKVSILNPNKQEYNTDNPQSTPRAIPSSNKKNTTSSRSSENLKKSGIQTNKVGSLPPAKENALPVDEDGNSTLDQKTKDNINDFVKKNNEKEGSVKIEMDGDVPNVGKYIVDVASEEGKGGISKRKISSRTQDLIDKKGIDLTKLQGGLTNVEYKNLTYSERKLLNKELKISLDRGELDTTTNPNDVNVSSVKSDVPDYEVMGIIYDGNTGRPKNIPKDKLGSAVAIEKSDVPDYEVMGIVYDGNTGKPKNIPQDKSGDEQTKTDSNFVESDVQGQFMPSNPDFRGAGNNKTSGSNPRELTRTDKYVIDQIKNATGKEVDFTKPLGGLTYNEYTFVLDDKIRRALQRRLNIRDIELNPNPYGAGSNLTGQGKITIIGLDGKTYKPGDDGYNAELMKMKVAANKPVEVDTAIENAKDKLIKEGAPEPIIKKADDLKNDPNYKKYAQTQINKNIKGEQRPLTRSTQVLMDKVANEFGKSIDFTKPQGGLTYNEWKSLTSSERNRIDRQLRWSQSQGLMKL